MCVWWCIQPYSDFIRLWPIHIYALQDLDGDETIEKDIQRKIWDRATDFMLALVACMSHKVLITSTYRRAIFLRVLGPFRIRETYRKRSNPNTSELLWTVHTYARTKTHVTSWCAFSARYLSYLSCESHPLLWESCERKKWMLLGISLHLNWQCDRGSGRMWKLIDLE